MQWRGRSCQGETPGAAGSSASSEESPTIYPVDQCQAVVTITGALQASWKGNAQATPSDESTLYQSSDGKKSWITATPKTGEEPAQVVVTVKGTSYTAAAKAISIEESDDGAEVEATIAPAKGQQAKAVATFTCAQG
ncbi:hypothetical protein [Nocardioides pyridinolyticus]